MFLGITIVIIYITIDSYVLSSLVYYIFFKIKTFRQVYLKYNMNLISSSVIFFTAITILTGEKLTMSDRNFRIPYNVFPVHYRINLTLPIGLDTLAHPLNIIDEYTTFYFEGKTSIMINILRSMQYIKLHTLNLATNRWNINLMKNDGMIYELRNYTYSIETNLLNIIFIDTLFPGLYTVSIKYVDHIRKDEAEGFYARSIKKYGDTKWLIATHIQAIGARRIFPCLDEPQFKTTFTISLTHYSFLTALSNMPPEITGYMDNRNFMWTHFHTTPQISTYQIAIVLTNFPSIRINPNISLWCEKCSNQHYLKFAQQVIKNITLHFESEFKGIKMPQMNHVVIPNFPYDGTSKWGLIFHREGDLIYDEQLDPVMRKTDVARLIAPKIAYQWFGNVVSPYWWSHLWLHESLAILFGEEAIVKIFNNSQMMDLFIVESQYESLHLDFGFDMNPPRELGLSIDLAFSFPRYIKAIVVLRMFQSIFTDVLFRRGVNTYLYKYKFNSLHPYEFWSIQRDLFKTCQYEEIPMYSLDNWLQYRYHPTVIWTQENPSHGKLKQYFNNTLEYKWWISTNVITKTFLSGFQMRLTRQSPFSYLEYDIQDDWVIIDIQQGGYYRVNYESENWYRIGNYLMGEKYKDISVINRAKMIDDAFHSMMARQLNISMFWQITQYLSQETDYVAWYPMLKVFEYMSSMFPFSKDEISFNIQEKLKERLMIFLAIVGFEERATENDFIKCLRQEIAKWACTLEYSMCLEKANFKLQQHLKDPELFKILPGWKEWTYCKGLVVMDPSTWINLTEIWPEESGTKFIEFLPCFQHPSIIHVLTEFLELKKSKQLAQNATKEIIEHINVFHSIVAKHAKTDTKLEVILRKFEKIKPKEISTTAALIDIINHAYSKNEILMISRFLHKQENNINIEQITSQVYSKIELRLLEIKTQINYFKKLLS